MTIDLEKYNSMTNSELVKSWEDIVNLYLEKVEKIQPLLDDLAKTREESMTILSLLFQKGIITEKQKRELEDGTASK